MTQERILVLGGKTGLLGQALVRYPGWEQGSAIETLGRDNGDITDERFLAKALHAFEPTLVINTIAWTQVDDAEDHPEEAKAINVDFPAMLATILAKTSCHLLHISTDFVFGQGGDTPYTEEDMPHPASVYGKTKYVGEGLVLEKLPGQSTVVRTAWLFGPFKKNFVATILAHAKHKPTLRVVCDQVGSPSYTVDVARFIAELGKQRASGLWHAVNSGSASWYALAKQAVALAHLPCDIEPIPSDQWPQKATRPSYSVLSNHKLEQFLHAPIRCWEEALASYGSTAGQGGL
ncbi:MAG: dTDP-4-dehydrorhamnose reductase [Desulfovibrio sp.]|nr:dTDP-4-dehydrorhamnose reductase [Desulfovibrio sp.]